MPDWAAEDVTHMQAALDEARLALAGDEVPVGAVVVRDGTVVAASRNCTVTDCDPGGHAELVALRRAARVQGNHRLTGATLYVTLEPCVMCAGAIAQARVGRVVFGAYDARAGALGSVLDLADSKALNHRFEVNGGLLADESAELLRRFFRSRR